MKQRRAAFLFEGAHHKMDTDLYPRVWSFENLYLAYRKASRRKRDGPLAASFELDLDVEFNKKLNGLFTKERGFITLLLRFMVRCSEIQQVLGPEEVSWRG